MPSALLVLTACAGAPQPAEPDPKLEEDFRKQREAAAAAEKRETYELALIQIDQVLDKFVQALAESGISRADLQAEGLARFLRENSKKWYDQLLDSAIDASIPRNQAIAVAVLGFTGQQEVRDPLLNALRSPEPAVVTNAAFGLGMLMDPRTPVAPLAEVVEDSKQPIEARISASNALMRIQEVHFEPQKIYPVWARVLTPAIGDVDGLTVVHALRGLGMSRDPQYAPTVQRYLTHPAPLVRAAAAVALGRLAAADSWQQLLPLLGPAEMNPNVRLAARKALEALAGGESRGYDVAAWRTFFEKNR